MSSFNLRTKRKCLCSRIKITCTSPNGNFLPERHFQTHGDIVTFCGRLLKQSFYTTYQVLFLVPRQMLLVDKKRLAAEFIDIEG